MVLSRKLSAAQGNASTGAYAGGTPAAWSPDEDWLGNVGNRIMTVLEESMREAQAKAAESASSPPA